MIRFICLFLIFLAISLNIVIDDPAIIFGIGDANSAHLIFGALIVSLIVIAIVLNARLLESPARIMTTWFATACALFLASENALPFLREHLFSENLRFEETVHVENDVRKVRQSSSGEVEIPAAANGNYYTNVEVNGERFDMIIDTGATYLTLKYEDAEYAGIDPADLTYSVELRTANGTSKGAITRLNDVTVAGITVNNVNAIVTEPGALGISLLGMSYLSRISGFSVKEGRMVLSD